MGRKSALTEAQWKTVGDRLLKGEKPDALGKEFGISGSSIRSRFSAIHGKVKEVANQIVSAESALRDLPISAQISAMSLADELRAISMHLAGAARFGAATAHRLKGIAHAKVQLIDDAAPLNAESVEELKGVAVLTKIANDAASIGLNLLAANKGMGGPEKPDVPSGLGHFYGEEDADESEDAEADS